MIDYDLYITNTYEVMLGMVKKYANISKTNK